MMMMMMIIIILILIIILMTIIMIMIIITVGSAYHRAPHSALCCEMKLELVASSSCLYGPSPTLVTCVLLTVVPSQCTFARLMQTGPVVGFGESLCAHVSQDEIAPAASNRLPKGCPLGLVLIADQCEWEREWVRGDSMGVGTAVWVCDYMTPHSPLLPSWVQKRRC